MLSFWNVENNSNIFVQDFDCSQLRDLFLIDKLGKFHSCDTTWDSGSFASNQDLYRWITQLLKYALDHILVCFVWHIFEVKILLQTAFYFNRAASEVMPPK